MSTFGPDRTPYSVLGHESSIALAARFYDHMDAHEPALVKTHPTIRSEDGGERVTEEVRRRFALFLVEWLGGPQDYSREHGHPRLRMRHAHVPIDVGLRDAWMRCMNAALAHATVDTEVREFLERRFAEVADFLRNR